MYHKSEKVGIYTLIGLKTQFFAINKTGNKHFYSKQATLSKYIVPHSGLSFIDYLQWVYTL